MVRASLVHRVRLGSFVCALAAAFTIGAGCGGSTPSPFNEAADGSADGTTRIDGEVDPGPGGFDDAGLDPDGTVGRDGAIFSDASPDVDRGDACIFGDGGPAPHPQRCARATANECDGVTDQDLTSTGVPAALLNAKNGGVGAQGNGFDDDCDGLVDEGCKCDGNGQTKDCFLVPASQANGTTKKPVGWCESNSKGSLDCAGTEFAKWSGTCRGAQPPYRHDVCVRGDYNCDGVDSNSDVEDCACKVDPVQCPTGPITMAPYPNASALPRIDGSGWIADPGLRASATNWTWTVIGGDCDNVLPNPTYAIYTQAASSTATRRGLRQTVVFDPNATPPRYVVRANEPLIGIQALNYGNGIAGGQIHPAFGLSGDYLVQGEFDLNGKRHVCTQKVEVRAPGIRAELCWDTAGSTDVDLHFARLQGLTCPNPGWDDECSSGGGYADCWYNNISGCRAGTTNVPGWGYASSADTACRGWSSPRLLGTCTNPRLDRDNITCTRGQADPTNPLFCAPENINLDNPNNGDKFMVGVTHFGGSGTAKPHVNVYCNGQRVLSAGYNPATGQNGFPLLINSGMDAKGDFWNVARITANVTGGQLTSCNVEPVRSHIADASRDGLPSAGGTGNGVCVDSHTDFAPTTGKFRYTNQRFHENAALQTSTSGIPNTPTDWCKH